MSEGTHAFDQRQSAHAHAAVSVFFFFCVWHERKMESARGCVHLTSGSLDIMAMRIVSIIAI